MKKTLEELRHARSKKDFPFLSLEKEEYVELVITRSKISLIFIWFFTIVAILVLTLCAILLYQDFSTRVTLFPSKSTTQFFSLLLFVLYALIILIGFVGTKIHFGNKLFITNKRAIQISVSGLFSHSTNIVELSRIEDVSFKQSGIIQTFFHYGTIRMSTVGDETTYTFPFVDTPTDELDTISHLIHVLKKKS